MYVARILFLFILLPGIINSQGIKIGIDWVIPSSSASFSEQISLFEEAGVSIIQIEGIIPLNQVQKLQNSSFQIWLSSGVKFTRKFDFRNIQALENAVTDPLYYYRTNDLKIYRYTLIEQPQIFPGIGDSLTILINAVQNIYDGQLDILTHSDFNLQHDSNIRITNISRELPAKDELNFDSYLYFNSSALKGRPSTILRELWSDPDFQNHIFLFSSEDFFHFANSDEDFIRLVTEFSKDVNAVVALQLTEEDARRGTTTEAILLLLALMIFMTIFLSNAGYHRSITRFTTTHNFYVNDVMMRRVRAGGDVLFAWIMTFLFGGILFHVTVNATSDLGTSQMLSIHYPFLYAVVSSGTIPQLILSSVVIIVLQLITFIWICLATRLKFQPSQILQLYLIPQQIIVLLTIIALLIFLNNGSAAFLVIFTILGLSMIFLSFHIIAFDLVKYIQKYKLLFLVTGPILYTIILLIILIWLYHSTPLIDTIKLYMQIAGI